jgi:hypothetical protein
VWWMYVIIVVLLLFGVYAFLSLAGYEKRWLTHRTSRTAESMYDSYTDGPKRH